MPVTISLDDKLAQRLEFQARALRLTLDDWAVEILQNGFVLQVNSPRWRNLNARRLALIHQRRESGLSRTETAELTALQELTAKAMEPWDRPLVKELDKFEFSAGVSHDR